MPEPHHNASPRSGSSPAPHQRAESAALAAAAQAAPKQFDPLIDSEDELTELSNAAVDLIQAGKLGEAESVARDLLARFPEVHDGYDRLGRVCEARCEWHEASECYLQVLEIVRAHPEHYDSDFEAAVQRLIEKTQALAAASKAR